MEKVRQSTGKRETVRSRIRPIGNSKGVIFNTQLLKAAGISGDEEITIAAGDGIITITKAASNVNTDLKTWDAQFKKSIKSGHLPEADLFDGIENEFDKTEW
jgi:antitoxin component of MazEF toxin-antitoxin module